MIEIAEQQKADSLDASSEHNSGNSGSSGQDDPPQARVQDASRQLYGAPANASRDVTTDDEPPRGQGDRSSPSQDEEEAVQARHSVRKHMAAKFGSRNWVLPVPTPEVDPRGFDDPVCDKFWKQTWAACAVHNVRILYSFTCGRAHDYHIRPKYIGKCSTQSRTIRSLHGNSIRNSFSIMKG